MGVFILCRRMRNDYVTVKPVSYISHLFIRFGLNVALTHQNRSYRDSESQGKRRGT